MPAGGGEGGGHASLWPSAACLKKRSKARNEFCMYSGDGLCPATALAADTPKQASGVKLSLLLASRWNSSKLDRRWLLLRSPSRLLKGAFASRSPIYSAMRPCGLVRARLHPRGSPCAGHIQRAAGCGPCARASPCCRMARTRSSARGLSWGLDLWYIGRCGLPFFAYMEMEMMGNY